MTPVLVFSAILALANMAKCGVISGGVSTDLTPPISSSYGIGYGSGASAYHIAGSHSGLGVGLTANLGHGTISATPSIGIGSISPGLGAFASTPIGIGGYNTGFASGGIGFGSGIGAAPIGLGIGIGNAGTIHAGTTYSQQTETVNIPVPQPYAVPVDRPVPVPVAVPRHVDVPRPVRIEVPQPFRVEVTKPYPVAVPRPYPVPVKVKEFVKVPTPVHVRVPKPYPVAVPRPYPVSVPTRVEVNVPVPVQVHTDAHIGVSAAHGIVGGGSFAGGHSDFNYSGSGSFHDHGQLYDSNGGYKY